MDLFGQKKARTLAADTVALQAIDSECMIRQDLYL